MSLVAGGVTANAALTVFLLAPVIPYSSPAEK